MPNMTFMLIVVVVALVAVVIRVTQIVLSRRRQPWNQGTDNSIVSPGDINQPHHGGSGWHSHDSSGHGGGGDSDGGGGGPH
jgi:uncharacterized membrane protein YgcG